MKVLWMAATPCGSIRRLKGKALAGGWLISLEDEIKKLDSIELSVAYISAQQEDYFLYDGVHYYPIMLSKPQSPIQRVMNRWKNEREREVFVRPQLEKVIRSVKPDIIHIHGTEGILGISFEFAKDIPVVFSIQGLIAPYKEKFYSGMSRSDVQKRESLFEYIKGVSSSFIFRSFCERGVRECDYLKNANYVFGRTFWDREISGLLNPNRKYFIVNEIMRPPFYKKQWQKTSFSHKLKIVSTISSGIYKGYEIVLKTAKLLVEYADFEFEWRVIGYDCTTKWVNIAESITGIKSGDCRIQLHGNMDADNLSDLLVDSDIYVHVSHIENSPNSVCEAMLIGMPVIATYAGGTATLLENEKEGILIQDGDPYVLAGSIVRLREDFALAKRFGANARRRAHVRHNPMNVVAELTNGYTTILRDYDNI